LNHVDEWQQISDWTLKVVHLVTLTGASSCVDLCPNREPTALFRGDADVRCLAGSSSLP
jgi:hypothetical protein